MIPMIDSDVRLPATALLISKWMIGGGLEMRPRLSPPARCRWTRSRGLPRKFGATSCKITATGSVLVPRVHNDRVEEGLDTQCRRVPPFSRLAGRRCRFRGREVSGDAPQAGALLRAAELFLTRRSGRRNAESGGAQTRGK